MTNNNNNKNHESGTEGLKTTLFDRQFHFEQFPDKIQHTARAIDRAFGKNHQLSSLLSSTQDHQGLTQETAYQIAAAICGLRLKSGQTPIGRKIGFTNPAMWEEYGVEVPNWSYLYVESLQDLGVGGGGGTVDTVDLRGVSALEPRIEPEIVLGLKKAPSTTMDARQLMSCVGWIAHGLEIVVSIFPDWKFTAADTTAACALHHRLLIGPKYYLEEEGDTASSKLEDLMNRMNLFQVDLSRNGTLVDSGKGSNALGGPISALHHLVQLLGRQDLHPTLCAGEIVTTGTLTSAPRVENDDRWSTRITGIELPGLEVCFKM